MLAVVELLRADAAKELEQAEKLAIKSLELKESAVLKLDYAAEVALVTAEHLSKLQLRSVV